MGRIEESVTEKHLAPEELEYQALTLKAIGGLLLAFDGIIAVFVFVGIRVGSMMWLYWTAIEGLVGIGLVAAGMWREQLAAVELGRRVQPHLRASAEAEGERPEAA